MKSITVFCIATMLCSSLLAQEKKGPVIKALYIQAGLGLGQGSEFTVNTNISADIKKVGLLKTNYRYTPICLDDCLENERFPSDELEELSLMYGIQFPTFPVLVSLSTGLNGVKYTDRYNYRMKRTGSWFFSSEEAISDVRTIYYLGAGFDAQIILHAKYFGIGLEGFAHWNPRQPYYGFLLNLTTGLIARK